MNRFRSVNERTVNGETTSRRPQPGYMKLVRTITWSRAAVAPRWREPAREGSVDPFPGLGADLDGVPRGAEGRGVAEVEVADLVNGQSAVDRCGGDVDPLGDLAAEPAHQLDAEEPSSRYVDSRELTVVRERGVT